MLGGVVRGVRNDSVCEFRFPVYGNSPVCRGPMDGDVKEVYLLVCLALKCELECRVYCVEVCQYVSYNTSNNFTYHTCQKNIRS